jgi:hypothetical protein
MTQVWLVKYDESVYLFKDRAVATQSINDMYDASYTFETEEMSDQAFVVAVMRDGHVQDRIGIVAFDVHEHPTVIHRYVTEVDGQLVDYDRPPKKPQRQEF